MKTHSNKVAADSKPSYIVQSKINVVDKVGPTAQGPDWSIHRGPESQVETTKAGHANTVAQLHFEAWARVAGNQYQERSREDEEVFLLPRNGDQRKSIGQTRARCEEA
jgi:hypothetical protein